MERMLSSNEKKLVANASNQPRKKNTQAIMATTLKQHESSHLLYFLTSKFKLNNTLLLVTAGAIQSIYVFTRRYC